MLFIYLFFFFTDIFVQRKMCWLKYWSNTLKNTCVIGVHNQHICETRTISFTFSIHSIFSITFVRFERCYPNETRFYYREWCLYTGQARNSTRTRRVREMFAERNEKSSERVALSSRKKKKKGKERWRSAPLPSNRIVQALAFADGENFFCCSISMRRAFNEEVRARARRSLCHKQFFGNWSPLPKFDDKVW